MSHAKQITAPLPSDGTLDQVLAKKSSTPQDVRWQTHQAFKVGEFLMNTGTNPAIELGYGVWEAVAQGLQLQGPGEPESTVFSGFSGLKKITVGTTPDPSPSTGDLWVDTSN